MHFLLFLLLAEQFTGYLDVWSLSSLIAAFTLTEVVDASRTIVWRRCGRVECDLDVCPECRRRTLSEHSMRRLPLPRGYRLPCDTTAAHDLAMRVLCGLSRYAPVLSPCLLDLAGMPADHDSLIDTAMTIALAGMVVPVFVDGTAGTLHMVKELVCSIVGHYGLPPPMLCDRTASLFNHIVTRRSHDGVFGRLLHNPDQPLLFYNLHGTLLSGIMRKLREFCKKHRVVPRHLIFINCTGHNGLDKWVTAIGTAPAEKVTMWFCLHFVVHRAIEVVLGRGCRGNHVWHPASFAWIKWNETNTTLFNTSAFNATLATWEVGDMKVIECRGF